MGIEIYGWIEMAHYPEEPGGWAGVVAIGSLIDQPDAVSNALFGIAEVSIGSITPLAAHRGLPRNPSADVQRDAQEIRRYVQEHGDHHFLGFTYVNFDEVLAADLTSLGVSNLSHSDWSLVFSLIDRMRASARLSQASFRIVCWAFS